MYDLFYNPYIEVFHMNSYTLEQSNSIVDLKDEDLNHIVGGEIIAGVKRTTTTSISKASGTGIATRTTTGTASAPKAI